MLDRYGRNIDYMRISLTNNCNLRCSYCMPENKIPDITYLSEENVLKCVKSAVLLGITHFKLTGGEPLVYPDIDRLIGRIKDIKGVETLSLTTNGVLLKSMAYDIKKAGLDSVNVSLDTLKADEFIKITGRDSLQKVTAGIERAVEVKIPIKINTVLRNNTDVISLVRFASEKKIDIRFIEMMPLGYGKKLNLVPEQFVVKELEKIYGKAVILEKNKIGNGPAIYYRFEKLNINVGLIQAIHGKFCDKCNRIRLTSDAKLKPCLAESGLIDLSESLCSAEDKIVEIMKNAIYNKPVSHHFEKAKKDELARPMNTIGG